MRAIKTLFLLTALTLLLVLGGQAIAGERGMTLGLVMAVVMNGVAYFFSDKIALMSSGAQPVSREQLPRLYEVMERLCGKAGLPMPKLYVIPLTGPNAFATGLNPKQASVAATLAGAIMWIASMGRWAMIFGGFGGSRDDNRGGGGLAALIMLIVAPIAAMLIQLGISRQREFAADASGARMVGHPYGLISALEKLGAYNKRIPMDVPPATASLFIVAPLSAGQVFSGMFSTHPPLSERIAVLRNMTVSR